MADPAAKDAPAPKVTWVRVVVNETPDTQGRLTQAGQLLPAARFADVDTKIAAHVLAPVDPATVVPPDAAPTAALLATLRERHAAEDKAWAKTQAPPAKAEA